MGENSVRLGGCHCGAVRFEVKTDLEQTHTCNCSICEKTGSILAFVPAAAFRLTAGTENLSDYFFNKKVINHRFCKTCGIRSFAQGKMPDGSAVVAVNVRCLDGIDLQALDPKFNDGRSL